MYRLAGSRLEPLTEASRARLRRETLAAVPLQDMIVFAPKPPQQVRAVLHVFTDIDCGYCQRLHQEVPALNAQGVEVRYLAWPRAAAGTDSYNRMVTAWCAADRQQAMTRLKQRQSVPPRLCTTHPLREQQRLGSLLGVRGTPALVFESGELQPGYLPAAQLLPKLIGQPGAR